MENFSVESFSVESASVPRPTEPRPSARAADMSVAHDPSRRFVLPEDSPLLANLAALWARDPKLAEAIDAIDELPSYAVEASRHGEPTLTVSNESAQPIRLHSRYQPLDEARQLVASVNVQDRVAFHVHGFGLGYHVQELFDRAASDAVIFVIEPDLVMLRTALEQRDYTKMLSSGRLAFFWTQDKSNVFTTLTPHSASVSMGFEAVTHAPSVQLAPQFHEQYRTWIAEFEAYCRTTMATLVLNGRKTSENVAANLGWYVATPSAERLRGAYQGRPAIVVSAGPSLRKNKHLLPRAAGKACIIAVQTTLQPLLEIGVEPQFVTSLDYHDICTRFFEKLPPGLQTELVAEPKATSAIFGLHPGPLTILGNDFAEALLAEMKPAKAKLPSGATVAHLAFYLAEFLGCSPIIFVGQDLGFSDGLCYSPGTSYDDVWRPELSRFCTVEMKQWEQIVRDRQILRKVPDHLGRPTYTEERLFTYLQHFERDFARSGATIIDATEGGVLKRGAEPMRLADAIERYCTAPLPRIERPHAGVNPARVPEAVACLEKRRDEARQIERVSRDTLPLLEEVRDHLVDQRRVNRAIARIDALRSKMHGLGATYQLVMQLTQRSEMDRYMADRRISAAKVEGLEKQRRQVTRDIENVKSVIEAAVDFVDLMDRTIAALRETAAGKKEAA